MKSIRKRKNKRNCKRRSDLLNQLVALTGVPGKTIRRELGDILQRKQINLHDITLEQLRTVVACYLRQIMSGILERTTSSESHRS